MVVCSFWHDNYLIKEHSWDRVRHSRGNLTGNEHFGEKPKNKTMKKLLKFPKHPFKQRVLGSGCIENFHVYFCEALYQFWLVGFLFLFCFWSTPRCAWENCIRQRAWETQGSPMQNLIPILLSLSFNSLSSCDLKSWERTGTKVLVLYAAGPSLISSITWPYPFKSYSPFMLLCLE